MKIAIPTDDGIMLSGSAKNPKGYLILTLACGEIVSEEVRWNKSACNSCHENNTLDKLKDCSFFIVKKIPNDPDELHLSKSVEVIISKEEIITNIIIEFINTTLRRESNTCCSP